MASRNKQVVLHPIVFAIYPAAFLYSGNKALFPFSVALVPAAVCALIAGCIWYLLTRLLSDWNRAAVVTSAIVMATFSYSAVATTVRSFAEGQESDFWARLIGGCLVVVIAAVFYVLRYAKNLGVANYLLNIISILLVVGPLFQVGLWSIGSASFASQIPDRSEFNAGALPEGTEDAPDIYYFVLDGYAREDLLRASYGFDNSEFTESLRKLGFAVANKAVANYPFTLVSVNSSLNFSYLQDLFGAELAAADSHGFLRDLMQDSRIVRLLKSADYQIISYEGEYWEANIGGIDTNIKDWWFPNIFSLGIIQMTPLPDLLEAAGYNAIYELHRIRTAYPFDHIQDAVDLPGPKFVYAHTYFGHPPFVFGPNGERVSSSVDYTWNDGSRLLEGSSAAREAYMDGYRGQITYLNQRVLKAVRHILENSKREPIIIMHGDHGPGSLYDNESLENTDLAERYSIFYAAHLPGNGGDQIYDSMSPINGLRIVLNEYFGTTYDLLEDRSFFVRYSQPYDYTPIPSIPAPVSAVESSPNNPVHLGVKQASTTPGGD